jgi:hypothetical protein
MRSALSIREKVAEDDTWIYEKMKCGLCGREGAPLVANDEGKGPPLKNGDRCPNTRTYKEHEPFCEWCGIPFPKKLISRT